MRGSAACLAVAGALFVGVQVKHPPLDLDLVGTTEFTVRQATKLLMAALALVGVAGLYLRQTCQVGALGLVGYLLFSLGYLTMFAVESIAEFVLPSHPSSPRPATCRTCWTQRSGDHRPATSARSVCCFGLSGVGFIIGGAVFGSALLRAGVVSRWASALLTVATAGTASLAVLPESFNRPMAVPTGVALIWLGWSSWRTPVDARAARAQIGADGPTISS